MTEEDRWHILTCPPARTLRLAEELTQEGARAYVPLVRVETRTTHIRRPKSNTAPAWPGYIFASGHNNRLLDRLGLRTLIQPGMRDAFSYEFISAIMEQEVKQLLAPPDQPKVWMPEVGSMVMIDMDMFKDKIFLVEKAQHGELTLSHPETPLKINISPLLARPAAL